MRSMRGALTLDFPSSIVHFTSTVLRASASSTSAFEIALIMRKSIKFVYYTTGCVPIIRNVQFCNSRIACSS